MKRKNRIQWYGVLLLTCCLTACQVKRPDHVLQDDLMEEVLYDYHIAKAMGEEVPYNENYKRVLYIESVFKKHGITQADFDSSMVWFARNPEVLAKIYEKVNLRLKVERDGINHLIAMRPQTEGISSRRQHRCMGLAASLPADRNAFGQQGGICFAVGH